MSRSICDTIGDRESTEAWPVAFLKNTVPLTTHECPSDEMNCRGVDRAAGDL